MKKTLYTVATSVETKFLYGRWIILVLLNAILGLMFSLEILKSIGHYLGVVLAIISFIILYASLDHWLVTHQKQRLAKKLRLSAFLKAFTQVFMFIDLMCGMISLEITNFIFDNLFNSQLIVSGTRRERSYSSITTYNEPVQTIIDTLHSYTTTMIDGFLLSIIVGVILFGLLGLGKLTRIFSERR